MSNIIHLIYIFVSSFSLKSSIIFLFLTPCILYYFIFKSDIILSHLFFYFQSSAASN